MMKQSSVTRIRRVPYLLLAYLVFMIGLQAVTVYTQENNVVIFKAEVSKNFHEETYKKINSKEFEFVTGLEGKVYWKANSFGEAFVLTFFVGDNQIINALGSCYIIVLAILLFWVLRDLNPQNIFGPKIKDALSWISGFFALLTFRNGFQWLISNYILEKMTDGKFRSAEEHMTMLPFLIGGFVIIPLMAFFVNQAQKNEQEQNLTV